MLSQMPVDLSLFSLKICPVKCFTGFYKDFKNTISMLLCPFFFPPSTGIIVNLLHANQNSGWRTEWNSVLRVIQNTRICLVLLSYKIYCFSFVVDLQDFRFLHRNLDSWLVGSLRLIINNRAVRGTFFCRFCPSAASQADMNCAV